MFLIRSLFWLSAVVMVLPASKTGDEPPPRVGLIEAALAMRVIAHDLVSVCERNPNACETSWNAGDLLWRKVETGLAIFQSTEDDMPDVQPPPTDQIGSLLEDDLEPIWSATGELPLNDRTPETAPDS